MVWTARPTSFQKTPPRRQSAADGRRSGGLFFLLSAAYAAYSIRILPQFSN
ncbi:MAG: hypothetical protein HYW78_02635 [Parcubacteria group bacterium]|nr:hypothetical protein [Parcubacteria group bacterium]